MKRTLALLLSLALLLALLPVLPAEAAETRYVLPVFETSDLHGHLVDTSSDNEAYYQYRLAYIADKVDDARGGDASHSLLLDGGDIYQGQAVSNLQDGWPMVAAFDAMEYDAVGLGNHEFDWGITKTTDPDGTMPAYTMNGTDYDSQIPILCCNIYYAGTSNRVNFTKDYVIVDKTAVAANGDTRNVRVAVVGYVNNYASSIISTQIAPYTIRSGVSQAENIARRLLNDREADCAVLLTHADAEDIAGALSSTTPFVLVCGGHSHQSEVGTKNGVTYVEPYAKGGAYASAELCFYGTDAVKVENARIVNVTDNVLRLYDNAQNQNDLAADVLAVSHAALEGVTEALTHPLGYITTSVTGSAIGDNNMSSTAGNWMTDLANRATGAKVSFMNSGGIRASFYVNYGKRTITKGDIFTIAPFGNHLYVYDITYAELLQVLNYAIGSGSGLGLRMSGIDCYYQNSSVRALVEDGKCIYKNGVWRTGQASKTIRVSTNEFIATSSGTPFYKWNGTSRFVDSELVDNESFIQVLELEGGGTGLLYVDPNAHLIKGSYSGELAGPDPEPAVENPFVDVDEENDWFAKAVLWAISQDPAITNGTDATHFSPGNKCTRAEVVQFLWNAAGKPEVGGGVLDAPQNPFTDVSGSDWYYSAVLWAVEKGVTNGTDATHFAPDKKCTRAEVVQFLYNAAGKPVVGSGVGYPDNPFHDVSRVDWYCTAVLWAVEQGITSGTDATHFAPDNKCIRAEVVQFLYKAAQ